MKLYFHFIGFFIVASSREKREKKNSHLKLKAVIKVDHCIVKTKLFCECSNFFLCKMATVILHLFYVSVQVHGDNIMSN